MKIGILTFHWATNYGAILQAYALQEYLKSIGHEVNIINYKPKQYDFSWKKILFHPSAFLNIGKIMRDRKKELSLQQWRMKHLLMTRRFYTTEELKAIGNEYDMFISGSDQILNPSFTLNGEKQPTSAYYLTFANTNKQRIGYAVSFGCIGYPENAISFASKWISSFDKIGVREQTGLQILNQLDFQGPKMVVPDPTILLGEKLFEKLDVAKTEKSGDYTCVYMLRREISVSGNVRFIDEKHHPLTMEEWLRTINNAKNLITNSYHGTIMALFAKVPFVVLLEKGIQGGMNDRFYTLLGQLGLDDRVVTSVEDALQIIHRPLDFNNVDDAIEKYRKIGVDFLNGNTD